MKPEEMDRAIAQHLGWELVPLEGREFNGIPVMVWKRPDGEMGFPCPCYSSDLNAMHEAEKTLSQRQYWEYADLRLKETVWKNGSPGKAYQCATADQRAETFLRAIGKWREE